MRYLVHAILSGEYNFDLQRLTHAARYGRNPHAPAAAQAAFDLGEAATTGGNTDQAASDLRAAMSDFVAWNTQARRNVTVRK